jgi:hypothetical protein
MKRPKQKTIGANQRLRDAINALAKLQGQETDVSTRVFGKLETWMLILEQEMF